jgi:opacity protein-like surface antigen
MVSLKKWLCVLVLAVVAGALLPAAPAAAQNDTERPWYFGLSWGWQEREDARDVQGAATVFHDGWLLSGYFGRRFQGIRVEGEAGLFYNGNKREIVTGVFDEPGEGNIQLQIFMLNAYYDFEIKSQPRWKPYVGFGYGMFKSEVNGLTSPTLLAGIPNPAGGFFLSPTVVDTASRFKAAYQWKIGVNYMLDSRTELFLGYRYFKGRSFTLHSNTLGRLDVSGPQTDTLEVGFRVAL